MDNTTEYSSKSKGVAAVLALFLGYLGVHRFYVGKVKTGILQILLTPVGIGFIWAIIDFIMIITGNFRDKNGLLLGQLTYTNTAYVPSREEFLKVCKLKCKQCGTVNTSYINMKKESSGFSRRSFRVSTSRGHDKYHCNTCKKDFYIENGIWVDEEGNDCNELAKKLDLMR